MGMDLLEVASVFGGCAGLEEEREGEIIRGKGAEHEGLEEGDGREGKTGIGEDTDGSVEREDAGLIKKAEDAEGEGDGEASNEASGNEVVLVGAKAEDSGVDLGEVGGVDGPLEEEGDGSLVGGRGEALEL